MFVLSSLAAALCLVILLVASVRAPQPRAVPVRRRRPF